MDQELLAHLFAAAIQFSGLPGPEAGPPIEALPYPALLQAACADLKAERPALQARYEGCLKDHRMLPAACAPLAAETRQYDQCLRQGGLVAAYILEEKRIVYRDDLDLENDADNSFLVHEYVHALQHYQAGDALFDTCESVLAAETQAYRAQQDYLQSRGQLLKVGERLRFISCGDIR